MKTSIIYMTKYGTTKKAANILKDYIKENDVQLFNLENDTIDIDDFDNIIIGSSIHAGINQNEIKSFCKKYEGVLLSKKLGLFLCCMEKEEKAIEQFENAYPEVLRNYSSVNEIFGGEILIEKMSLFEREIVKRMGKVEKSISELNENKIKNFAQKFTK